MIQVSSFGLDFQDDLIEAQVSDDAGDSTDEESSDYSGLEDDEDDSSDEEFFQGSSDDEEEGEEEEGSEGDDEDDGESDMSLSEDEEESHGRAKIVELEDGKPKASAEDQPSTSAQPVEDEYAYDSSDEEVIYICILGPTVTFNFNTNSYRISETLLETYP